jgi:hypothetical protein
MQMLESTSDPAGLGFDPERIRVLRCRLAGDPPCDLRKVEKLQQRIDKIRSRAEKIRSRMDKLCEPHWARVGLLLDQIDAMHVDVGQLDSEWDTIAAENFYYWIYDEETWGEYRYADLPDYRKSVKTTEGVHDGAAKEPQEVACRMARVQPRIWAFS